MVKAAVLFVILILSTGCWDKVEHVYDCELGDQDGPVDTSTEKEDAGTEGKSTDTSTVQSNEGQGTRPPGWENFGSPCETHDQCTGYGTEPRCLHSVMGLINIPDGFCADCCNEAGKDVCASGIDCIGVYEAYLICLAHCNSDDDCRDDGKWSCQPLPFGMDEVFSGDYCLPTPEYSTPDTDAEAEDPGCPWPWL